MKRQTAIKRISWPSLLTFKNILCHTPFKEELTILNLVSVNHHSMEYDTNSFYRLHASFACDSICNSLVINAIILS